MTLKYAKIVKVKKADVPRESLRRSTDMYGYGHKIPIGYMLKIEGSKHWLRVYMLFTSNSPTYYVGTKSNDFIVVDFSVLVDTYVAQHRYNYWNPS